MFLVDCMWSHMVGLEVEVLSEPVEHAADKPGDSAAEDCVQDWARFAVTAIGHRSLHVMPDGCWLAGEDDAVVEGSAVPVAVGSGRCVRWGW